MRVKASENLVISIINHIAVFGPILISICTVLLPDVKIQQLIEGSENPKKSVKYSAAQQFKNRFTIFITEELGITPILSLDDDLKPTMSAKLLQNRRKLLNLLMRNSLMLSSKMLFNLI